MFIIYIHNMNLPAYEPSMRFEKTHPDAKLPEKNHDSDAGWDLFSVESCIIPPRSKNIVPVGLKLAYLEPGYWIKVASRSGLSFKHGILAHPGVIDQNYRGDLGVLLYNHGDVSYAVNKGDRIAQLVLHFNIQMKVDWGAVQQTDRGEKGFGSSGK
jgi:dUTP pyrophosphatase